MAELVVDRMLQTRLSISKWDGMYSAPALSEEIETQKNARAGAVKTRVRAFQSDELKAVVGAMNALYTWWRQQSAPWLDGGWRVILAANSIEFFDEYHKQKGIIDNKLIPAFIAAYPAQLARMQFELGDLFLTMTYPDVNELPKKFAVNLRYTAVAGSDMLTRFGEVFSESQLNAARSDEREAVRSAMTSVWQKLLDPVEYLIGKIDEADSGNAKRWHESLISNIAEATQAAAKLNFIDSQELRTAIEKIETHLVPVTISDLKDSPEHRALIRRKAQIIKDKVQGYMFAEAK